MEFFIDSADIAAIREVLAYYPADGITTNPNLLALSSAQSETLFSELKALADEYSLSVFVQVTADTAEEMLEQAEQCAAYFGDHLVMKLPAQREGYRAVRLCREKGIRVCVTVIHSVMQGIMAGKAGAQYAAPYITHIDDLGADGAAAAAEMTDAFERYGMGCKVLGASFRTVDQIQKLAAAGCGAVTITPEMFEKLIAHPSTDLSMRKFDAAWEKAYGDAPVTALIPKGE